MYKIFFIINSFYNAENFHEDLFNRQNLEKAKEINQVIKHHIHIKIFH